MYQPHSILITGASSGLGRALALAYAEEGISLHLSGRNPQRLEEVAASCRRKGATVYPHIVDVTDREAMLGWISDAWEKAPFDLVIADAGISAGTSGEASGSLVPEPLDQSLAIFNTNVTGVIHTVLPAIEKMIKKPEKEKGAVAVISSLAVFRGLPGSPSYSASKAAVRVYGDSLRGLLKPYGIHVSVVVPGYIHTPMTEVNNFPMPSRVSAENAAAIIQKGLAKRKAQIVFPVLFAMMVRLLAVLPVWLTDGIFSRLPGKPAFNAQSKKKQK